MSTIISWCPDSICDQCSCPWQIPGGSGGIPGPIVFTRSDFSKVCMSPAPFGIPLVSGGVYVTGNCGLGDPLSANIVNYIYGGVTIFTYGGAISNVIKTQVSPTLFNFIGLVSVTGTTISVPDFGFHTSFGFHNGVLIYDGPLIPGDTTFQVTIPSITQNVSGSFVTTYAGDLFTYHAKV